MIAKDIKMTVFSVLKMKVRRQSCVCQSKSETILSSSGIAQESICLSELYNPLKVSQRVLCTWTCFFLLCLSNHRQALKCGIVIAFSLTFEIYSIESSDPAVRCYTEVVCTGYDKPCPLFVPLNDKTRKIVQLA